MMADHAPDVGGTDIGGPFDSLVPRPELPGRGPEADPRGASSGSIGASGRTHPGGWGVAIIASQSRRSSTPPTGSSETGPRSPNGQA